jgi:hypothetical protein
VAANYPGTKTGITEYNWGAESHINGGTTQADILGIFGRERLDVGVRWTTPASQSPAYKAFKMYRNYDGNQSRFGDLTISTNAPTPDNVSAFASLRTSDRKMTVMVIAKTLTDTTPVTVNLANFAPSGPAERWQLDSTNAITQLANVSLAGSSLAISVPAQSITLLVIPGSYLDAPANVVATASSTTSAAISWSAVSGATSYQVWRSSMNGAFAMVGSSGTTNFNDATLSANTAYLYKVKAIAGAVVSPLSGVDATTTVAFTNDPLAVNTTIVKAAHLVELRTAVNAMRAAAGLSSLPADGTVGVGSLVRAQHLLDLRAGLDAARSAIGLPALSYADASLASVKIKAAQVSELRDSVK